MVKNTSCAIKLTLPIIIEIGYSISVIINGLMKRDQNTIKGASRNYHLLESHSESSLMLVKIKLN